LWFSGATTGLGTPPMRYATNDTEAVWPLEHEVQAQALSRLLAAHGIPSLVDRYLDAAYDGIFLPQVGYGVLRVYADDHERAEGLIRDFLAELKRRRGPR